MMNHSGPIFSLKWNKHNDQLLSGSVDKKVILWDGRSGEMKRDFNSHTAASLDVEWLNENIFASCSTDSHIYVYKTSSSDPIRSYKGHTVIFFLIYRQK